MDGIEMDHRGLPSRGFAFLPALNVVKDEGERAAMAS